MATDIKQQLFESEARGWLRRGYTNPAMLEQLHVMLKEQGRSAARINDLVEEMRRQWARRREWLKAENNNAD